MNSATISQAIIFKTLATLLLLVAMAWVTAVHAVEIAPAEPIEQQPVSQQFESIGNNNQLTQASINKTQPCGHNKKGIIHWLTSYSRKPASFHYIDFIELFHSPR